MLHQIRPLPFYGDGNGHVDGRRHEDGVKRVEEVREEVDVEAGADLKRAAKGFNEREQQVDAVKYREGDEKVGEEGPKVLSGKRNEG